ncbi:hypothetical protein [Streptomyces sp. 900116325]|uniref:hypothetical protein n=1 Tax=Streptomyces sp. 900116325 TaxID=3154295 RepID=UPI0033A27D8B
MTELSTEPVVTDNQPAPTKPPQADPAPGPAEVTVEHTAGGWPVVPIAMTGANSTVTALDGCTPCSDRRPSTIRTAPRATADHGVEQPRDPDACHCAPCWHGDAPMLHTRPGVNSNMCPTGLPDVETLIDDPQMVEWRGGRAHHYEAE